MPSRVHWTMLSGGSSGSLLLLQNQLWRLVRGKVQLNPLDYLMGPYAKSMVRVGLRLAARCSE